MRPIEEIKADLEYYRKKQSGPLMKNQSFLPTIAEIEKELRTALIANIPLDRLEAICQAEKDGRCVVLPCKVGDTVYMNSRCLFYHDNAQYTACEVVNFRKGKTGVLKMYLRPLTEAAMNTHYHKIVTVTAIGVTVFLTY